MLVLGRQIDPVPSAARAATRKERRDALIQVAGVKCSQPWTCCHPCCQVRHEIRLLEVFAAAAQRHGRLFAVNDRADIARAVGAPILHLGQDDPPVPVAREIVGPEVFIGRSAHSPIQADQARTEDEVAYYCAGPVWTTPTKPGRPATGPELLDHVAAWQDERPWFAIGGIESPHRLDEAIAHGARRIVVVRAITQADDPGAATAAFASRLQRAQPRASAR